MKDEAVNTEMRACDGDDKVGVQKIAMVAMPVGLLAMMGLVFLWCCPEWHPRMLGEHLRFKRQFLYNALGMVAFCVPLLAGWSRWLKWAPVMAAAWSAMLVMAHFCPMVNGSRFVFFGPIRLDVICMLPFALAMILAWISHKFGFRAVRMLTIAGVSILLVLTACITTNANRVSRIATWFSGDLPTKELAENDSSLARAWAQKTCVEALGFAHWFSANEEHLKDNPIPGRFTSAMPASAALVFGKWFLVLFVTAFGLLGFCFVQAWSATADQGKKAFLAVAGLGAFVPAILGTCECLGLTPMLYTCVPLVSYGGTATTMTWLITGTLASIWRDEAKVDPKYTYAVAVALIALVACFSIKVSLNENRLQRTKAWLGLGTPLTLAAKSSLRQTLTR